MGDVHTITISPGTTSGDICTDLGTFIIDDLVLELDETFGVEIGSISPCGNIGAGNVATVTITDNDGKIIVHFDK